MISEGQFRGQFEPLEASFHKNLTAKIKDGWYKELEYCDFRPFKIAMLKLKKGDKFPNFGMFWTKYNLVKKEMQGEDEVQRGCDGCRYGYIHYRVFDKTQDSKIDHTGPCRNCFPERKRALDPRKPYDYQPGMEPGHVAKSVQIPTQIAKAMIEELKEKYRKPSGVDWEKETKEAWEFHEKATCQKASA